VTYIYGNEREGMEGRGNRQGRGRRRGVLKKGKGKNRREGNDGRKGRGHPRFLPGLYYHCVISILGMLNEG